MKLAALYIHPIKSCAAVALKEARLGRRGLEHDRRWMVVDGDGVFLTQRTLPEMALVRIAIGDERLVVSKEGLPRLPLPFVHEDGARADVVVWDDTVRAVVHDEGSDWFARALGRPVRLVCMPDEARRPVEAPFGHDGDIVSFADAFPLLVVNQASLAALGDAVDARRFRPNLVVDGAAAWAEDDWRALRIGARDAAPVVLRTPKPCARCTIPGVDPDTAVTTKEPLRTLARLRTRDHRVLFGINAIPDGEGVLRVGDPIAALDM